MGFSLDDDNAEFPSSDYSVSDCLRAEYSEDDMKRVIVNCVSNIVEDEAITVLQNLAPKNKTTILPLLHCMTNKEDKNTTLRTIAQLLSDDKGTALHYAAYQASYILIAPLLDYGLDANTRCAWNRDMNQVLPLNVILDSMANQISAKLRGKLSAFKLVCDMCTIRWRPSLECVRLLAARTRELNEEIVKYMKEGKVTQLCALMLLGYDSRVSAALDIIELDDSTKEEQVLQLIQTFSRIGDKLQKYVALKSSPFGHSVTGVVSEIASMFNDAGLPVFVGDSLVYSGRYELEEVANCGILSMGHKPDDFVRANSFCSARQFHTSSNFSLRKEFKGQLAKVGKPSFQQLPAFRMCTLLFSIAKRGFK